MLRRTLTSALLLALASGCTPEFDEEWLVKDLRILAMQAEPPEVLLPSASATPPPVQISALVVDPRPSGSEALRWELWACTPEEDTCDDAVSRTLVRGATTTLDQIQASLQLTPQLLQRALSEDTFQGFGGVPVHVHLKVWGENQAEPVEAIKRVVYAAEGGALLQRPYPLLVEPPPGALAGACSTATPCDDGLTCTDGTCVKAPNRNPAITEVEVDGAPIPPDGAAVPFTDEPVDLLPTSPEDAPETYWVFTYDATTRKLGEYIDYSFFVTDGELEYATTGGPPSVFATIKRVEDPTNEWTPPEVDPGRPVTLWIVARDDRGGASWVRHTIRRK